jgi:D-proline reductase (dithiol) PrdB
MPALNTLAEAMRNQLLTMAVEVNASTPFTQAKPLAESCVAVVTSAGLHLRSDRPFSSGDPTYRIIPSNVRADNILQSHVSLHFDRSAILQDINVVFPVDRLREMREAGTIGAVAPNFYSVMGAQSDLTVMKTTTAEEVATRLREEGVDVVLLTPT